MLELQGTDPRHAAVLRRAGEERHHVRRTRRAHRQRDGRREGALHQVGDALTGR